MSSNLVERVRKHCRAVMDSAELVTVDRSRLELLIEELSLRETASAAHSELGSAQAVGPETVEAEAEEMETDPTLVFALDAINFGSGYHDIVRKRPGLSGARTMVASLTDYIEWTGPLTPLRLQAFTANDCSQVFGQELDGGALSELMGLFSSALQDLGHWLEQRGGATGAIDRADGSAVALAEALTEMPFYRDVGFYKRAQITAADLARDCGIRFDDLDQLTAFADNLVPHVLRVAGVLIYDADIAATIERGELLTLGSQAEMEIRAAGVLVVDELAQLLNRRPMDLDLALWTLGGEPRFKSVPRHRCRCVFY